MYWRAVGNVYYRRNLYYRSVGCSLCVGFGKMMGNAASNQLVTLTRCLREARPVEYRDLPPAALNQTCTFQFPGGICDGWPLDAQHFGEQILRDWQCIIIAAVAHHQQPTRQPFLDAVGAVARS